MKWTSEDTSMYLQSKEYVDTAIIPLVQIGFGNNVKSLAEEGEYTALITEDLERQLKGRVFLFPACTYISGQMTDGVKTIQQWYHEVKDNFKHIFFITSDDLWRNVEELHKDMVIYLPAIPLEHMDESLKRKMIEDQVSQILNIFLQSWKAS
ncbi:YpiF family protein [Bacillus sp. PAMC26568]|nr:YpiF family protein [Bacillus sp. PAMC26568]